MTILKKKIQGQDEDKFCLFNVMIKKILLHRLFRIE